MDHSFSKGFPFEIDDLWRPSTFRLDNSGGTLFQSLPTDFPKLELENTPENIKEQFHIPELGQADGLGDEQLGDVEPGASSPIGNGIRHDGPPVEPPSDIWTFDLVLDGAKPIPRLHTWEAFEKKNVPHAERTACVSEAGPKVFDAALRRLETKPVDTGVLPQDVLLRSLCNLALGRSSLFFRWDVTKKSFVRTLAEVPISGFSAASSDSLLERLLDFGSKFRNLEDYGRSTASYKHTCTAIIAFKGCIVRMLDCIEQHITKSFPQIRSALRLQSVTARSHQLLEILQVLTQAVKGLYSDEDVISALSTHVNNIVIAQTCFAGILRVVLARVSAPWLERLCVDLGLSEDRFHQRKLESEQQETHTTDDLSSLVDPGASDAQALPDFVEDDDRKIILECKQSLKALRQHMPEHSFFSPHSRQIHSLASDQGQDSTFPSNVDFVAPSEKPENLVWADSEAQLDYLGALDTRMSQPITLSGKQTDQLDAGVDAVLHEHTEAPRNLSLSDTFDFNPVEQLRPLIQAHARLINRTILRHIFETCRLRHHLDLQRQYQLFGNGDFVARLSKALFSPETQSAERRRGIVPTGETMGLRLGTRDGQRWPPASSELRLTLAGVMTETYHPEYSIEKPSRSDVKELPGGLSFSVRELPDEEIERVLDSGSIYALDFLKLQYNAPPGLEAIITRSSMQAYDSIFRRLLRMLRVLDATTKVKERLRPRAMVTSGGPGNAKRFAIEAHHVASVLVSHFMDIGIESPWKSFIASIADVEDGLKSGNEQEIGDRQPVLGLYELMRLHEQCLESMRSRLFLRRKHEKIRSAIEDALAAILKCAAVLEKGEYDGLGRLYTDFETKVAELLSSLRTAADRPGKMRADMNTAENDAEAMSLLLKRLNWNRFYQDNAT